MNVRESDKNFIQPGYLIPSADTDGCPEHGEVAIPVSWVLTKPSSYAKLRSFYKWRNAKNISCILFDGFAQIK